MLLLVLHSAALHSAHSIGAQIMEGCGCFRRGENGVQTKGQCQGRCEAEHYTRKRVGVAV